jgi:hypothetical protein
MSNSNYESERKQHLLAKLAGRRKLLEWVQLSRIATIGRISNIWNEQGELPLLPTMLLDNVVCIESSALLDIAHQATDDDTYSTQQANESNFCEDSAQGPHLIIVTFNGEKNPSRLGQVRHCPIFAKRYKIDETGLL